MDDLERERRAAEIFSDALERDGAGRDAFLEEACAGDATLRAEVDSLIAALGPARELFRAAPRLPAAGIPPPSAAAAAGSVFGPYRVLRVLAEGGMGEVLLAERTDSEFRKQVAIKRIRPGLGTREILERFRQERQLLADLEHPNIARLLDGGSTPDGLPYLVMEYVDGVRLDAWCRERGPDVEQRLRLFLRVCDAVHYAHRNLVVHRDLKPGNILVDRDGTPKLLDFGIAKVLSPGAAGEGGADAALTTLRALTPRYASPEQVRGGRITTSTDVYSLGVLLYELLAGRSPYAADTGEGLERAVCEETPPRPSRAAASADARAASRLRGDLDTIVLRALAKDPERRYASAGDLAADIRRHLDGLPVTARPDTAAYRVTTFVRRNRALAAAVAGVIVLLAAALSVTAHALRRAAAGEREARFLAYTGSLAAAEASLGANREPEAAAHLRAAPPELRGFEWRHLHARLDRSLRTLAAHRRGVTAIAFAADGTRFLTASLDSTIALWGVADAPLHRWSFDAGVESVALAGGLAVAGLGSGRVLVLPLDASAPPREIGRGDQWPIVDITRDGARIAAGFLGGAVRVWDARDGRELAAWNAHPRFVQVRWDPTGQRLWTGGADGRLRAWDAPSYRADLDIAAHGRRIYSLAVGPGGRVAAGSMDRTVSVWDPRTGARLAEYRGHDGTISGLAFARGEEEVLSAGADGRTLVWSVADGSPRGSLPGRHSDVMAVAVSPDGATLVTGEWGGRVKTWAYGTQDVRTLRLPRDAERVLRATDVRFDASGERVAIASNGYWVVVSAWRTGGDTADTEAEAEPTAVAWTADGRVVVGEVTGGVALLDPERRTTVARIAAHAGAVHAVATDAAHARLFTAGADSCVRAWSLPALDSLATFRAPAGVRGVDVSPDGALLAVTDEASGLRLVDARTGDVMADAVAGVRVARFANDGAVLAAAEDGSLLRVRRSGSDWRTERGPGPAGTLALAVSPDGTRVAIAGQDESVRLLDAVSLRAVAVWHGHQARVAALHFAPDGSALASASYDGTVRVWDAPPVP